MAERRITADGRILERDASGPIRVVGRTGGGVILPAPAKTQYEGQQEQATLGKTQAEINSINNAVAAKNRGLALEERKFDYQVNQDARPKPGEKQMQEAVKAWAAANEIENILPGIEASFKAGPGSTSGVRGLADFIPSPANRTFNTEANRLRAPLKSVLGFQGGDTNAASEAAINVGPFVPNSWEFDQTNRKTIGSVRQKAADARTRAALQMGGIPDSNGRVTPIPQGYRMGQFPDLDKAIADRIDRVPLKKRQSFILEAQRRYHAINKRNAKPDDGMDDEVMGYLKQYGGR